MVIRTFSLLAGGTLSMSRAIPRTIWKADSFYWSAARGANPAVRCQISLTWVKKKVSRQVAAWIACGSLPSFGNSPFRHGYVYNKKIPPLIGTDEKQDVGLIQEVAKRNLGFAVKNFQMQAEKLLELRIH